ncbi:MAG: ATPase [Crocinitomicaceae bacterium]|nr:ATPase [Crocinitomicaceae bacterium]|tara:strand:- start:991 stop:1365 length:375 start_codon:yes stop_codon:yes gene_type:complete
MKNFLLLAFAIILSTNVLAQKKADITFSVSAVCGMCEDRIEEAYDVKGIVIADYDLKTKKLHVVYKTKQFPNELDVHKIAAAAGHDTEKIKATDEAYANLHSCCKYREGANQCSGDQDNSHDND